jgi:hypothetical protein
MHILPCIRAVILPREISSNGKLMTGGIRLIIWDVKVYLKFLYLTFCRRVPVLSLLLYEAAVIEYNGKIFQGCSSLDFLKADQILIPLEKLYRRYTGESLAVKLSDFTDVSERIQYLVTQVEKITKIDNFGAYLTAMLEIDAFFMNEDRHTNNIAVIYNEKTQKYELSPFFDQGLCMFADINQDYPIDQSLEYCLEKIEAKPFSSDFDIQLDAAEELYGIQIGFQFTFKDIQIYLQKNSENYPREVVRRVEQLLRRQMRKYGYLMKK